MAPKSRKAALEQQATSLFRDKGYAATSMRDLATHFGVEAASLYSHIRNKEELLYNICFPLAQDLFAGLENLPKDLSATERLLQALISHVTLITRSPDQSIVFLQEYRHLSEPARTEFLNMRKAYEQKFKLIIRQGIRSGEFRKIDEKITTLALLSAVNSTPYWFRKESGLEASWVATLLSDILIHGLSNKTKSLQESEGQVRRKVAVRKGVGKVEKITKTKTSTKTK